jgi:hypothetical protein
VEAQSRGRGKKMRGGEQQTFSENARSCSGGQVYKTGDPLGQEALVLRGGRAVGV